MTGPDRTDAKSCQLPYGKITHDGVLVVFGVTAIRAPGGVQLIFCVGCLVSPNNVVTLEVLTVRVKHRCQIEVLHQRVRLIRCYLQDIHASCMVVIFDALYNFVTGAVSRDLYMYMWIVFRNRRKSRAKAAFWCLYSVSRSILAVKRLVRAAACES